MKAVGARSAHRIHNRAVASKLRAVGIREHLKLGNGIHSEGSAGERANSAIVEIFQALIIHQESRAFGSRSSDGNGGVPSLSHIRALAACYGTAASIIVLHPRRHLHQ